MKLTKYIQSIVNILQQNESRLNDLDAAIGDGDHGSNVVRGFKAILEQTNQFTESSLIEKDLMVCAQQLMSKIGGSSGPLLGSAFMALSISFKGKNTFTNQDIANGLQLALDRISQLGKSTVGEKTMLDALSPAIQAMKNATGDLNFKPAAIAAQQGAEATIPLKATKGRASYLGERSIGHMDPGACSIALIFEGLCNVDKDDVANVSSKNVQHTQTVHIDTQTILPVTKNVNILVVSHSEPLAKATVTFVSEMKSGDFKLDYIAGIDGGAHFGSDPQIIKNKIEQLTVDAELLIIYDLGSSKMNTEMAYSMLAPEIQARVKIASVAFVEGTLIAVVSNHGNSADELKATVESQAKIEK
ncbi:MAG: dihydroxyacetone kinase subunit L [Mycoplasmataceae bacterium]|jgi:dihydroxyacetone kinase-like protein|nr:dihydroxyacetone kinase subunit L [Mycoplasmataceae bacterium]